MRGIIGGGLLLALLIGIAIWAYAWGTHTATVAKKGQETKQQAEQISGRGPDGQSAENSVKLDPKKRGDKLDALVVTDVTPGGAMDQYFHLQKGDEIIQIGQFTVRDYPTGEDMAEAGVFEAAQRQQPLVVRRNGQTVTLTPPGLSKFATPGGAGGIKIPGQ